MPPKADFEILQQRIAELESKAREHKAVEEALQYRLRLEALITSISSKFINLPTSEIDDGVNEALRSLGEFTQVDRSYIFRYDSSATHMDNTHEWCAPGIEPHIQRLQNIPLQKSAWLISQINRAEVVHIPYVSGLPPEAAVEKKELEREGIKSLIMVPTEFGGSVTGFLGLDSVVRPKSWPRDVIALLRIFGEIFTSAIERKLSEQQLSRSEEKYRNILETIAEAYWEIDLAGNLTFFNNALCELAGLKRDQLMGLSYRDYTTTEMAARMYETFNRIYSTGERTRMSDFEMIDSQGNTKHIELSASLIRDAAGLPIGFRGLTRDVTERKQAEKALRESEKRYHSVLEANPDPVIVCDAHATVIYFNPAFERIFGWRLEDQIGKPIDGFVPGDRRAEAEQRIADLMAGNPFSGIETARLNISGERIPVSLSGAVYRDLEGKPVGSVITIRDIREKKKLEQQLLNAHKMESIGTLAGGIAHDFNNLLTAIQGNVSLAMFEMDPRDTVHRLLENVQSSVKSGARLTAQLLGFARKGQYEVKPLDLNRLARDVIEAFGRTRKTIEIHHDLAPGLLPVEADEGQIEQVLLNMFVNAGHAMEAGGELHLQTANVSHREMQHSLYSPKPGRYVRLTIRDTGAGMDPETMAHIFEPFFTTKDMGRGTGLGLASAYGIIKGHGGYIDVDSELNRGTMFRIYLPATEKMLPESPAGTQPSLNGTESILLVDDEEMVREVAAAMLTRLGYAVIEAADGQAALEAYRKAPRRIELVILDMIMPRLGGGEVFDQLKRIDPNAKVLLSSGYSFEGEAKRILERGCNGFIQKPFSIGELSAKIRRILDG